MSSAKRKKRRLQPKRRLPITPEIDAGICEFIREWRGVLTWKKIIDKAERSFGHRWTRQTLHKHENIFKAYQDKTEALKNREPVQEGDIASMIFMEKIERQEIEIRMLEERIKAYDEKFIRYQANAHRLSINPAELEQPLQPVVRRRDRQRDTKAKSNPSVTLVHSSQ